jgi:hypothetical protein
MNNDMIVIIIIIELDPGQLTDNRGRRQQNQLVALSNGCNGVCKSHAVFVN